MNRRSFNKMIVAGMAGANEGTWSQAQNAPGASAKPATKWPAQVFRRVLVDTHVPDWHPDLLSRFDPADYVATIARAGFQSLMQYAISCAGLCLWRTKIGEMHRNMKGRDFFGEVMDECKKHGLHRVCYFHVIWDNWAYEKHPDWRIRHASGDDRILESRYGFACPNTPYRQYAVALIEELTRNYEFESMFVDMLAFGGVCYCPHCIERFWKEHQMEPPRLVDWDDPAWRTFQKARQRWLVEFGKEMTAAVKKIRPITTQYQFASIYSRWTYALPMEVSEACDYLGGDFNSPVMDPILSSLVCKGYEGLSRVKPFELMASISPAMSHHVMVREKDQFRFRTGMAAIHSAAFMMIDQINPDGTVNKQLYEYLRELNEEQAPYEPFLGGEMLADVAIYFDKQSTYNPDEKGVPPDRVQAIDHCPHRDAFLGAGHILREAHIPFGVVTNLNLDQLERYRAVILPNVLEMMPEHAARFRRFVERGGILSASGLASMDRFDQRGPRFLLEDVLGVRYKGKLGTKITYLTPKNQELRKVLWPQEHLAFAGSSVQAEALPGTEVLATVTLPFVPPEQGKAIGSRFASIIGDPPALASGTDPGIVVHSFGKGKTVWVAAPIESSIWRIPDPVPPVEHMNVRLVLSLLRRILPGPFYFEADTHPSVEMTLFHQPDKRRLLAGLLSVQQQLPPIPVGATVRVRVPEGRRATAILRVPDRKPIPFEKVGPYVQFRVDPFPVLAMAVVEYQ